MTKSRRKSARGNDARPPAAVASKVPERITLDLRWYHALALFAALTFVCRAFLTGTALGFDDAFITYRFAYNNAQGHWFQWNVGEPPVYGTTTFLYAMLLTVVGFLGLSIPIASVVMSALAQVGAAGFAFQMVRRCGDDVAGLLAGILVAADGFGITATLGMETYLYVFLLLGGLWFYQSARWEWAAVFAALLGITRLDGFLLAALLALHYVGTKRSIPWKALAAFGVVLLPWVIACQGLFGSVLPSSFQAKHMHRLIGAAHEYSPGYLIPLLAYIPPIALLVFGSFYILRSAKEWRGNVLLLLGAFVILNVALYEFAGLPNFDWYYVPQVVGAWILAAAGIRYCIGKLRWIVFAALCMFSVLVSVKFFREDPFLERWHTSCYVQAGQWLQDHAKPGQSVAAAEVGIIGFTNPNLKINDVMGLVSPSMIENLRVGRIVESLAEWKPDYLFLDNAMTITSSVFCPEAWLKFVANWSTTQNPNWMQEWGHWYEDHYEPVQSWPIGTRWWDGEPAQYILARRKVE